MGSIGVRTLDGKHTSFAFSASDTGHSVKQHLRATWGLNYRLLFRVRAELAALTQHVCVRHMHGHVKRGRAGRARGQQRTDRGLGGSL
jgi:hypothetical protein